MFLTTFNPRGHSRCATQRESRDFGTPDPERGIHIRDVPTPGYNILNA